MPKLMSGKTCLITGANSGIGLETAKILAGYGAGLILLCRDRTRGENAAKEITETTGNGKVCPVTADLSSFRSIRDSVEIIKSRYDKLHVLINNAGTILFERKMTEENQETTFTVNCLAPFLLTNLLLDLLTAAAPSRIVNVVSEGLSKEKFDISLLQSPGKYNALSAYTQSKQAEILFTFELAERLKGTGIAVNCFYPGLVKTNLGKADKGFRRLTYKLLTALLKNSFVPIEESVKPGIYLAISRKAEKLTGKFLLRQKDGRTIVKSAYDKTAAKELWTLCERLVETKTGSM